MAAVLAAVGDLHVAADNADRLCDGLRHVRDHADALLVAGDLTRRGTADEARVAADLLAVTGVPVIAVLGNHDVATGDEACVTEILNQAGVEVLEGSSSVVCVGGLRVGVAGVRGFCGGFGNHAITGFGEPVMLAMRAEAEAAAAGLDRALASLTRNGDPRVDRVVVLLHYSPIRDTVLGEPPEIWPFLGSSLLAAPIDHHRVDLVVHGHAHHGCARGETGGGVPVHNVALPVLDGLFKLLPLN